MVITLLRYNRASQKVLALIIPAGLFVHFNAVFLTGSIFAHLAENVNETGEEGFGASNILVSGGISDKVLFVILIVFAVLIVNVKNGVSGRGD